MTVKHTSLQAPRPRLLHRVLLASSWALFGYFSAQSLRFVGNLFLTRLLFPEAFGLMAIAQTVLVGITMLSDVGIEQSIIHNKDGNSSNFINTAWTLQATRGLLIWLISCLLAIPVSYFYQNPEIALLLPAIGLSALIGGLASTKIASASRNLGIAAVTLIDLGTGIVSTTVMIVGAWMTRSIWSLVAGSLTGVVLRTVTSHYYLKGTRNRFQWDSGSLRSIFNFGGWIFVSTAVTFLVGEGNRLLIGSLLNIRELAFFSLATTLNLIPLQIVQQIGSRALFPAYSETVREQPERLYGVILKARLVQIVPLILLGVILIFLGESLIGLLYDERYQPVGRMLKLLALGVLPQSVIISYGPLLWAKGLVRKWTVLLMVQLFVQVTMMIVGSHFGGPDGLLLGISLTQWILYPFYAFAYSRLSLWQPQIDLPVLGLSFGITILALFRSF